MRRGFSLIELLLVLVVMAAVAAMAWPMVQRQFASYRLRTAADMIRTEWCMARMEAMRSGSVYAFRHRLDGNRFCTKPRAEDRDTAPAESAPPVGAAEPSPPTLPADEGSPQAAGSGLPVEKALPAEKALPEGVGFGLLDIPLDAATEADAPPKTDDVASPDWSEPIFFYPDGTTSDAQLTLKNDLGRSVEISLHGLTGTVDVGEVLVLEE